MLLTQTREVGSEEFQENYQTASWLPDSLPWFFFAVPLIQFCQVILFLVACSFAPSTLADLGQCSFIAYISHNWMGPVVVRYGISIFGLRVLPSLDTALFSLNLGRSGTVALFYIYAFGYMLIVALP